MRSHILVAALFGAASALGGCGGGGGGSSPQAPTAVIGSVAEPALELTRFSLDASGSTDPQDDALVFAWEQIDGPIAARVDAPGESAAVATFAAPKVTNLATLRFRVTVVDPDGNSDTAEADVSVKEGRTVVYVANHDRLDAFEVFRAHESDEAPVKLHADVAPVAGVASAGRLAVSPDRRFVAYTADREGDGTTDVIVARLDGGGEVKLATGAGAVGDIVWAPDSGRLAFTAGATTSSFELFTARPDGQGGAAKVSGSIVAGGGVFGLGGVSRGGPSPAPQWASAGSTNAGRLAFTGDLDTDGVRELYVVAGDGSGARTKVAGPVRSFSWSRNGDRLVMQGELETAGIDELFVAMVGATGAGTPSKISGARAVPDGETAPDRWILAPVGGIVAFTGVLETAGVTELFAAPLDGSGRIKVIPGVLPNGAIVGTGAGLAWSADGSRLVFSGRIEPDLLLRVYSSLADGSAPTLLSGPMQAGMALGTVDIGLQPVTGAAAQRVSFLGDLDTDGLFDVYSAPIDGSAGRLSMSRASGSQDAVGIGAWSPDGRTFVMFGDLETDGENHVFAVAGDGSGARVNLSSPIVTNGALSGVQFTADSGSLILSGDLDVDQTGELYVRDVAGAAPRVKISNAKVAGGRVLAFETFGPSTN